MNKTIWMLLLALNTTFSTFAQTSKDSLDLELSKIIEASKLPGLGVSIADDSGVLYANGFGYRDVKSKAPYNEQTIQQVASISKTFIGLAVMQLVEAGKVSLEDNVNDILPFQVHNPNFPKDPIKLIHLVTHTSSIQETDAADNASYFMLERTTSKSDFPKGYYKFYKHYLKNKDQNYSKYAQSFLSENGGKYTPKVYGNYKPGEQYAYTNIGACLAAYIVELTSGQSFIDYTQSHIIEPLGLKNTGWKKAELKSNNIAQPYFQNGAEAPAYRLISYPSGGLHTSSYDMALYMTEIMKGYTGKGQLLSAESYQVLLSNQINSTKIKEKTGVFWSINGEGNIGHGGAEIGTACNVLFSPKLQKAIFVMVNISSFEDEALQRAYIKVLVAMSQFAKRIN